MDSRMQLVRQMFTMKPLIAFLVVISLPRTLYAGSSAFLVKVGIKNQIKFIIAMPCRHFPYYVSNIALCGVEQGGTVVNHDGQQAADVLIQGERIVAVGTDLKASGGSC
jgi:hypothetical protein